MKRSLKVFDGTFLSFAFDGDELFTFDVFEFAAFEDLGTFERCSVLAGVRETSLQIGITSWSSWGSPLLDHRRWRSSRLCGNRRDQHCRDPNRRRHGHQP
jgi:hypothetical protein